LRTGGGTPCQDGATKGLVVGMVGGAAGASAASAVTNGTISPTEPDT
jgi:hypothetical protein